MFYLTGLLFAATMLVGWAGATVNHGSVMADQVCDIGGMLCKEPKLLFFAAIAAGLIALFRVSVKS
jgi:hypothetical protein